MKDKEVKMQEKNGTEGKAEQRRFVLWKRDRLSLEKRERDSQSICERILCTDIYRKAETIFLFNAFGSEVDLSAFGEKARSEGKRLLYPFCLDREHMLALEPGGTWETDRFGIRVPALSDSVEADPAGIDLILCPCAGFDDSGRRLGMGGGYYDRFFLKCPQAFRLLVAFEAQRLEYVITESQDIPMDGIITEERIRFL